MEHLKLYRSHKLVHAEPMYKGNYDTFREVNGSLRSSIIDGDSEAEGYHIVYELGSDDEYHSWCPKDKFEKGNKLVEAVGEDGSFLGRLKQEYYELVERQNKLLIFIGSAGASKLSPANLSLLNKQSVVMQSYIDILVIRLELNIA